MRGVFRCIGPNKGEKVSPNNCLTVVKLQKANTKRELIFINMAATPSNPNPQSRWELATKFGRDLALTIIGGNSARQAYQDVEHNKIVRRADTIAKLYSDLYSPAQYTLHASRDNVPVDMIEEDLISWGKVWKDVDFSDSTMFEVKDTWTRHTVGWRKHFPLKKRHCELILYEPEARTTVPNPSENASSDQAPNQGNVLSEQSRNVSSRERGVASNQENVLSEQLEGTSSDQQDPLKQQFDQFTPTFGLHPETQKKVSIKKTRTSGTGGRYRGGYTEPTESQEMAKELQEVNEKGVEMTENSYNPCPRTSREVNKEYVQGLSRRPVSYSYKFSVPQPINSIWFFVLSAVLVISGSRLFNYARRMYLKQKAVGNPQQLDSALEARPSVEKFQRLLDEGQRLNSENRLSEQVTPKLLLDTCQACKRETITKKTAIHILTTYFNLSEEEAGDMLS